MHPRCDYHDIVAAPSRRFGKWRLERREAVVHLAESADLESDLVDVAGIDLARLADLPDSVLANSLRRILSEGERMSDQYAIFQNAIG